MEKPDPTWIPSTPPIYGAEQCARLVVHFWAKWNGYDRAMDATLSSLRSEYEPDLQFRSCEIDLQENFPLARAANVLNIPALALVVDGAPVDSLIGLLPEDAIRRKLDVWQTAGGAT